MNKCRKVMVILLFVLSIVCVVGAPYIPSFFFSMIRSLYDYHYVEIRFTEIISSFRMTGIVLAAWGIALLSSKSR